MIADSLIVIGLATVSLGTIHEADGPQQRSFWLRNAGTEATTLAQGYTSCGCTTIGLERGRTLAPGDSARVDLTFNPRGKGGEFWEMGTVVYGGDRRKTVELTLTGHCILSEATLLRQFPVEVAPGLRLSAQRFDVGRLRVGETCERHVVLLHRDEGDRRELLSVSFTPDAKSPHGLQHVVRRITTEHRGKPVGIDIVFDVIVMSN